MRGDRVCPTGQKKIPLRRQPVAPFFISTRKGWVQGRPLIRPGFAGPPSPQGRLWGVGETTSLETMRRRLPALARAGTKCNLFLHGHVPGKKHISASKCARRARAAAAIPQFWEPSAAGPKIPTSSPARAPQNTARPPPAGRPPGRSTPRPPRLGGSSRPSPARGRRR